jgi:hypothetical protein
VNCSFVLHPALAAELAEHCRAQGDAVDGWIEDALGEALDRDRAEREREEGG